MENQNIYLATFAREQAIVITRDFTSTDWTQLLQTYIRYILHPIHENSAHAITLTDKTKYISSKSNTLEQTDKAANIH